MWEKIKEKTEKYLKRFDINIPVKIEKKEHGQELFYDGDEAIILLDENSINEVIELVSQLNLGINYNPLFATFISGKELNKKEEDYFVMFYLLTLPLLDFWVYKNMKKYLTRQEIISEIEDLFSLAEMLLADKDNQKLPESMKRRVFFTVYLIDKYIDIENYKLPASFKINLFKYKKDWSNYISLLENFAQQEPDYNLFIELAERTNAPYIVKIKNNKIFIKERK